MSKSLISIFIILLLIVLATTFVAFAPDSWKFWKITPIVVEDPIDEEVPDSTFPQNRITAKHQFKNGTHIIVGEVNLPTPCNILTTTTQIAESYPEQVTLKFFARASDEICAQVITVNRFKMEFKASDVAKIQATWNGKPVEINLIPVGQNEDLTKFDIFIKG